MYLEINPEYEFLKDFVTALPQTFDTEGSVLYKARNEVRLIEAAGIKLVVKKFKVPHLINRFAYTFIRKSKARRSFEHALILKGKGIETPTPVAYIEFQKNGLLYDSYYVSLECPYKRMMREFWESDLKGREDIIKEFAKFSARLHASGVYHVDYSPGNILFEKNDDGIRFSVIDINRMKFMTVNEDLGYKNFERLWISEDAFRLLAKEYALARDFNPEYAEKQVIQYKNRFMKSRGYKPKANE